MNHFDKCVCVCACACACACAVCGVRCAVCGVRCAVCGGRWAVCGVLGVSVCVSSTSKLFNINFTFQYFINPCHDSNTLDTIGVSEIGRIPFTHAPFTVHKIIMSSPVA